MAYPSTFRKIGCIIPIVLIAIMFTSCVAPHPVTKLVPEAPDGYVEHGREYISLTSKGVNAMLGFDGFYDETLIFDLVVVNKGDYPVSISCSEFYYEILDSATAMASTLPRIEALSIDTIAGKYDNSIEKMKAAGRATNFVSILSAAAGVVFNASGFIATENPGYIFDIVGSAFNTAGNISSTNKDLKESLSIISDEKSLVQQASLRDHSLNKDESVSGFVFFPQQKNADYYMFCFPVEEQLFQFVYHQKVEYQY